MEEKEISIVNYLEQLSKEIEKGGGRIKDTIKVEMSVAKTIGAGGKVIFWVVDVGGKYQKENLTKVNFEYYPKKKFVQPINQFKTDIHKDPRNSCK